jgi:hypothetical protein
VSDRERGQATIELIALLPLCLVVVLAIGQVLAAGSARSASAAAAQAGAMALLQGGDAVAAARAAAPGWARDRLRVQVDGREVRTRIVPRTVLPGTAALLTATGRASAGPRAVASVPDLARRSRWTTPAVEGQA